MLGVARHTACNTIHMKTTKLDMDFMNTHATNADLQIRIKIPQKC